jgi:hypothetical protein
MNEIITKLFALIKQVNSHDKETSPVLFSPLAYLEVFIFL